AAPTTPYEEWPAATRGRFGSRAGRPAELGGRVEERAWRHNRRDGCRRNSRHSRWISARCGTPSARRAGRGRPLCGDGSIRGLGSGKGGVEEGGGGPRVEEVLKLLIAGKPIDPDWSFQFAVSVELLYRHFGVELAGRCFEDIRIGWAQRVDEAIKQAGVPEK